MNEGKLQNVIKQAMSEKKTTTRRKKKYGQNV